MKSIRERLNFLNLPILLFLLWMLLQRDWSSGQIALGALLSIAISIAVWPFRLVRATMSHPFLAIRLICHVAVAIVVSNYNVWCIVCLVTKSRATPEFLVLPLR